LQSIDTDGGACCRGQRLTLLHAVPCRTHRDDDISARPQPAGTCVESPPGVVEAAGARRAPRARGRGSRERSASSAGLEDTGMRVRRCTGPSAFHPKFRARRPQSTWTSRASARVSVAGRTARRHRDLFTEFVPPRVPKADDEGRAICAAAAGARRSARSAASASGRRSREDLSARPCGFTSGTPCA